MKTASRVFTVLIFVFLFAPIVILLVFSFNDSKSLSVFTGFTLKWYRELLHDQTTLGSVRNTLVLAVSAMAISTVMGTAASVGIHRLRSRWLRATLNTVTDIPMTNPDIITGISLMLMFVFFGRLLGSSTSLGFWSMLAAHITFCLPYVIMQVLPKLQQMDRALPEAAKDFPFGRRLAFSENPLGLSALTVDGSSLRAELPKGALTVEFDWNAPRLNASPKPALGGWARSALVSGEARWRGEKGLLVAVRYFGEPLTVHFEISVSGDVVRLRVMNTLVPACEIEGRVD